ncbi:hypothetical protein M422DRAFT_30073 [Sphaerobolus stellatus SS14]|uniref:Branched-chain-amino-acid transaminase n=1 Tax=Sphaerobolus stellatus (strain SS14) TaxID=990650 RepID=A0A0C9W156_SPHS4|nr:hypothetical protein M422DRAFT_30073 [Sphaerobolus stellatus SS14]
MSSYTPSKIGADGYHGITDIQTRPLPDTVECQNVKSLPAIDVSKLKITLAKELKPLPELGPLTFGNVMSDHMLVLSYDPFTGWSDPEIRPYGGLNIEPASSCFQYSTNLFEGMKAYLGPDGKPRLFRPDMNMARMSRSATRAALPNFDGEALQILIKKLVAVDQRWIPSEPGYSLYVRPTMIGTRVGFGVAASQHAVLVVLLSPSGPYFPKSLATPRRRAWTTLLASATSIRAWPGGTGEYKLALNYTPCFAPQKDAEKQGYSQILWLLPVETPKGKQWKVTECGQMNFWIVLKRDDDGIELVTPILDGTILPGVTRDSLLQLGAQHNKGSPLPGLSPDLQITAREDTFYMSDILRWEQEGRLLEAFGSGTAAILAGVWKVGWEGRDIIFGTTMDDLLKGGEEDVNGLGPIGKALYERIVAIQLGKVEGHPWSVPCE